MIKSTHFKIAVILFFLIFAYLSYMVIKPFFIALISAIILAYIFNPLHKYLKRFVPNKIVSSLILTLLIIILLSIPLVLFLNAIKEQALENYIYFQQGYGQSGFSECTDEKSVLCSIIDFFDNITKNEYFSNYIQIDEIVKRATTFLINLITTLLFNLPAHILNLFIMFFAMFFFFKDGDKISIKIKNLIPLKLKYKRRIIKRLDDVIFAVVYGNLIVALVQGSVAFVGYLIFGVKTPILWGFLTVIGAMIPFFGTATVWVPLSIFMFSSGLLQNNMVIIWKSIGLFIYGTLFIATIDNFIKPYIIGDKANIHPLVILLGVFGGIALIGPVGIILGPIILALFLTSINIYMEERFEQSQEKPKDEQKKNKSENKKTNKQRS